MNPITLMSNLDKLLIELVFQLEQDAQHKENMKEQIQKYTAKAVEIKQKICELHTNIQNCDENILNLQKHTKNSRDNCIFWKPTFAVFNRHEEFLQSQLDNAVQACENDKKIYQDTVSKGKETLRQYQVQYMESPLAKEYYLRKQEVDDIQNRVLKYSEQLKIVEKKILDALSSPRFTSYNEWALQLASLREDTTDILKQSALVSQKTSHMLVEAEELEMKMKYVMQHIENVSEDKTNNGNKTAAVDCDIDLQERMCEDIINLESQNQKQQSLKLQLPCLPKKLERPKREITLSLQLKNTGREEIENRMENKEDNITILAKKDLSIGKESQAFNPLTCDERVTNDTHVLTTNLQNQMQLRLTPLQKTQHRLKGTGHREEEFKETTKILKDSAYGSQDVHSGDNDVMSDNATRKKDILYKTAAFPRSPTSFTPKFCEIPSLTVSSAPRTPTHDIEMKGQGAKTPTSELSQNTGKKTEKSPAFSFFMTSAPETPRLNIFESSPFGETNLSDQDENFSGVNTHLASPLKDMGGIFGKFGGEEEFAFPFAPKTQSKAFDNAKDDFGFTFPFGQNQKTSQDTSFKEYEPSQSTMKFTFF